MTHTPVKFKHHMNAELVRSMLDYLPTPVVCTYASAEAQTLYLNREFTRLFGYTAADITSAADWARLAYPDEAYRQSLMQPWQAAVAQALATGAGIPTFEVRARCKDGSERDVLLHTGLFDAMILVTFVDITERKRTEERYRLLTESMLDVVWVLDLDTGCFSYVSPSVQQLRGYSAAEVMAQPMDAAMTPESLQRLEPLIVQRVADFCSGVVTSADHFTEMIEQPCKDGSTVWTEVITHFERNAVTGHLEVYGLTRNITQRKQAEDALRSSEEKFRLMFEHASAGIFLVGLDGRILKTNLIANTMFGYGQGELEGMTVNDIALPEDTGLSPQAMRHLREGKADHETFEKRYRHKDGRIVHGLVSVALVRDADGCPSHFISQVQDITQRYELEEKLRVSEERHRLLADNVSDALWTLSLDGQITYMSPSIRRHRGFTPEELMRMPLREQFPPESWAIVEQGLRTARADVAAGRPVNFRSELQEWCKDGSLVWTEITATSLYDREGRFLEIVGISRNIDERKQFEQELRRLATTDTLTGAWNRRRFEEAARQEIDRSHRYGEPLTLIVFDLDHFKCVNDRHGHQTGDRVLVELVTRVRDHLRVVDGLGRWGGEEFVVLMPHCDAQAGSALAEKLRSVVAEHPFETVGTVTVSFGVAQLLAQDSFDAWFKRADDAVYAAKAQGRNRVITAGHDRPLAGATVGAIDSGDASRP